MREHRLYLFTTTIAAAASIVLLLSLLGLGADFGANVWPNAAPSGGAGTQLRMPDPLDPPNPASDSFSAPAPAGAPAAGALTLRPVVQPALRGRGRVRTRRGPDRLPRRARRPSRATPPALPSPVPTPIVPAAPPPPAAAAPGPTATAAQQPGTSRPDTSDHGDRFGDRPRPGRQSAHAGRGNARGNQAGNPRRAGAAQAFAAPGPTHPAETLSGTDAQSSTGPPPWVGSPKRKVKPDHGGHAHANIRGGQGNGKGHHGKL